jgi:hypothetical protein
VGVGLTLPTIAEKAVCQIASGLPAVLNRAHRETPIASPLADHISLLHLNMAGWSERPNRLLDDSDAQAVRTVRTVRTVAGPMERCLHAPQ